VADSLRGMRLCLPLLFLLLSLGSAGAQSPQGYYRFPALHGDTIVFTAEGDLWRVPVSGGIAQRLTTHPGSETDAAISPDGQRVAFSAAYEGPTEIYVMPLTGGLPVRLTFDGSNARVEGWTPDGKVLYETTASSTLPNSQLATVDPTSGARRVLPLAQASQGVYDPQGRRLFFTRLADQGSRTKRYQGGTVQNLWSFAEGDAEAVALTADFKGASRHPMWWNDRVHFVSDRDGVMNLWSMKPDGSDLRQQTTHRDHDVKSPDLHRGRIVYQHGADLRLLDLASGRDAAVDIRLASDFDQQRERWIKEPMDYLTASHLSPSGDRVVLTARGQVFVAPVGPGRLVEVPRRTEVRYRNARFLPDGKTIVALTDESGELEFCQLPANGAGPAVPLTTNGTVFRFEGIPSPDGRRIAWSDKDHRLWIHELASRQSTPVATTPRQAVDDLAWSPDSQWLAFSDAASNRVQQIRLYRVADGTLNTVTSERVESYGPAWSPDGKWLYFLSDRDLRSLVPSPWGARQPDPYFTETTRLYALALTRDAPWPFRPKTELEPDPTDAKKDEPKPDAKANGDKPASVEGDLAKAGTNAPKADVKVTTPAQAKPVTIELDGLAGRLFEVPVPSGNYAELKVTAKHLLWTSRDLGFKAKSHLKQLEITRLDPKPKTLVEDISRYELSLDGKKLLVVKDKTFHVIAADAAAPAKLDDKVDLSAWTFSLIPREEWRQIYTESWRMMRDYFYDRGMHGVDWRAMHARYRPLVDRVSDRDELNDVISALVGELSALHIFVRFGDERTGPDKVAAASLGAEWVRDDAGGGWRVQHIHRGDPDYPARLSPLSAPGIQIGEGDVIVAINGRPTTAQANPEMLLRNQAGKQVLLEVKPSGSTTNRLVVVQPITVAAAADLRYDEWELTRREKTEELGRGQIGYVHLRAMGSSDIAQWARDFFPVFNRQALIIDVRHNRGGNIDSWILGKLLRKAWFYWQPRVGEPTWNMQYAFRGHLVVLCNERTASDGEAFSEGFRRLGLGKVIGTRTWGGEIWLSAQRWLVDSGMASAAEMGVYGPEGQWLIEGHGVDPDVVVDNLPHETFKGRDAQLEAAVKHLQELIAKDPRPVPPTPKYPDKSFKP
jgi:tricorn protease